ncbi:N-acetylmuramoyl-L-alanine amidase [Sporosarcina sp. FSL K6-2383]|uniref:peptidoglycan recognition protein family protein n=1 Tax=Sporosarcina sp. FSL K6-2383 TaxID=2921556 RepID=UPI00315A3F11
MVNIKDLRSITPRTNGTRALSAIKNIARHHSATSSGNWASFWKYWKGTKGWGTGGYHEIILRDGTVELCYDPTEITNGVGGQNSYIYNICLVGNGSFTAEQERVFDERARYWMDKLGLPASAVKGHNEFPEQSTNCPGVNMAAVRARLSKPSTDKIVEDKGLKFSSPTLQKETETSLLSKAHRQIVVDAAVKAGAHASWLDKLANKTLTDADVLGLAVKYTVATNK